MFQKKLADLMTSEYGANDNLHDSDISRLSASVLESTKMMKQLLSAKDTIQVWRKRNTVHCSSPFSSLRDRSGPFNLCLETNIVNHISTGFFGDEHKPGSIALTDTCYTYEIISTEKDSVIIGFKCRRYDITELLNTSTDKHQNRFIKVWVTNKIKPAIPLKAMLLLHKDILPDSTPLYISESTQGISPLAYPLVTFIQAIRIETIKN